eukprot:gnl/Chilomastix_cuspidata/1397.p1 GENE.gnl/Chilomastix_cuspidata/1397~~gnl/Chilomastix_cuspidata/1397.p1  ORF type:complete len:809 (+),score=231.11 gnl/Chilomastix_cuspidata/1397:1267-3693(+)
MRRGIGFIWLATLLACAHAEWLLHTKVSSDPYSSFATDHLIPDSLIVDENSNQFKCFYPKNKTELSLGFIGDSSHNKGDGWELEEILHALAGFRTDGTIPGVGSFRLTFNESLLIRPAGSPRSIVFGVNAALPAEEIEAIEEMAARGSAHKPEKPRREPPPSEQTPALPVVSQELSDEDFFKRALEIGEQIFALLNRRELTSTLLVGAIERNPARAPRSSSPIPHKFAQKGIVLTMSLLNAAKFSTMNSLMTRIDQLLWGNYNSNYNAEEGAVIAFTALHQFLVEEVLEQISEEQLAELFLANGERLLDLLVPMELGYLSNEPYISTTIMEPVPGVVSGQLAFVVRPDGRAGDSLHGLLDEIAEVMTQYVLEQLSKNSGVDKLFEIVAPTFCVQPDAPAAAPDVRSSLFASAMMLLFPELPSVQTHMTSAVAPRSLRRFLALMQDHLAMPLEFECGPARKELRNLLSDLARATHQNSDWAETFINDVIHDVLVAFTPLPEEEYPSALEVIYMTLEDIYILLSLRADEDDTLSQTEARLATLLEEATQFGGYDSFTPLMFDDVFNAEEEPDDEEEEGDFSALRLQDAFSVAKLRDWAANLKDRAIAHFKKLWHGDDALNDMPGGNHVGQETRVDPPNPAGKGRADPPRQEMRVLDLPALPEARNVDSDTVDDDEPWKVDSRNHRFLSGQPAITKELVELGIRHNEIATAELAHFTNGETCMCNGKGRVTRVFGICFPDDSVNRFPLGSDQPGAPREHISFISYHEVSCCEYELLLAVPDLCRVPELYRTFMHFIEPRLIECALAPKAEP